jgi:hypothetical protein
MTGNASRSEIQAHTASHIANVILAPVLIIDLVGVSPSLIPCLAWTADSAGEKESAREIIGLCRVISQAGTESIPSLLRDCLF